MLNNLQAYVTLFQVQYIHVDMGQWTLHFFGCLFNFLYCFSILELVIS